MNPHWCIRFVLAVAVTMTHAGCGSKSAGVPADSFRVSVADVASDDSQIKIQITLEAGSSGKVFAAGFGTPPDKLTGAINQSLEGSSTVTVTAAIATDPDGKRSLTVVIESATQGGKVEWPINMPIPDDLALEKAVSFNVAQSGIYKVGHTVTLATMHDRELILTVYEK
jgi:hypothetical protein